MSIDWRIANLAPAERDAHLARLAGAGATHAELMQVAMEYLVAQERRTIARRARGGELTGPAFMGRPVREREHIERISQWWPGGYQLRHFERRARAIVDNVTHSQLEIQP